MENLYLSGNQIKKLPSEMKNNWKLKHVYLGDNPLSPKSIIAAFKWHSGMATLDLKGCAISSDWQVKIKEEVKAYDLTFE